MTLINSYTNEEFENIAKQSNSWKDFSRNLGYNSNSGDLKRQLQKRVEDLNIDVSHFKTVSPKAIERNEENIFIENSTADQSVLRRWYKKGSYSDYKCSICDLEPFWNGKPLTLILDHINGNNKDDRLENLRWVCPNCNMQLPTTNRKKNIIIKKYFCVDCGKEVSKASTKRCRECNAKYQTIKAEEMPVTREELKNLIRTTPFTQIGKTYGVSDNAIRKWCDKFNLPRKVTDIKKYSDLDWSKI